jgi:hypothetical protein
MMILSGLLDGSLRGLATFHMLKADLLRIRGRPETRVAPSQLGGASSLDTDLCAPSDCLDWPRAQRPAGGQG